MTSATRIDATTVPLFVLVALLVLPVLVMGLDSGGMMGHGWIMGGPVTGTGPGWWPFVGMLVPPALLVLVLVVVGPVVLRRLVEDTGGRDPPMEALRMTYARGDLTDEEFGTRRRKPEESE
jgi:putative membrane protein